MLCLSVLAPPGTPDLGRSGKAFASLGLGFLALAAIPFVWLLAVVLHVENVTLIIAALIGFAPLVGLPGVILGHRSRASIRQSGGRLRGKGFANAGLVLGYLGLAVWLFCGFLPMFSGLVIIDSRVAANQASTVGSLRTINTAAITYTATYDHGFPESLAALVPAKTATSNLNVEPSEKAAGLIDEVLAAGTKSGYRITYIPGKPDETGKIQAYTVRADPTEPGKNGKMHYYTDQSGVIREENEKQADQNSKPIGG